MAEFTKQATLVRLKDMKILLGLTTTPGSDWREKVKEINKFDIEEIALFLTYLKPDERKELYSLLEKTGIKSIPHIHLRDDHDISELDYLVQKYDVKAMNLHCDPRGIAAFEKWEKYQKMIYFENQWITNKIPEIFEKYLSLSGGMCVDFSHIEDISVTFKHKKSIVMGWIEKYPIGCSHVSAVRKSLFQNHSFHKYKRLSDFNYLKKYLQYFPELVSIEVENSFEEQIKVKQYIEKTVLSE